jgi:hypothetical protein
MATPEEMHAFLSNPNVPEEVKRKAADLYAAQRGVKAPPAQAEAAPPPTVTPTSTTTTTSQPLWEPGSELDPRMKEFDPGGSAHARAGEAEIIEGVQKQRRDVTLQTAALRGGLPMAGAVVGALTPIPGGALIGAGIGAGVGDWISQDLEIKTGQRTAYNPIRTGAEMITAGYLSKFDAGKGMMEAAAKGALVNIGSDTFVSLAEGNGLPSTFDLATSAIVGSFVSGVAHQAGAGEGIFRARKAAVKEVMGSDEVANRVTAFMGPTQAGEQVELALKELPVQQKLPLVPGEAAPELVGPTLEIAKPGKSRITKEYMRERFRLTDEQITDQMGFEDVREGRTFHKIFDEKPTVQSDLNLKYADPNTRLPIHENSLDEASEWERIKKRADGKKEDLVPPMDRDPKFGEMSSWTRGMTVFGRPKDVFKRMEKDNNIPIYQDYHDLTNAWVETAKGIRSDSLTAKQAIAKTTQADQAVIFQNFMNGGDVGLLPKRLQNKAAELWNVLDNNLQAYGIGADKYFGEFVPAIARGQSIDDIILAGRSPAAVPQRLKYLAEDIKAGYLSGREPSLVKITSRIIELGNYRDHLGDMVAEMKLKWGEHPGVPDEAKEYINGYLNSLKGGGYDPSARTMGKVLGAMNDRLKLKIEPQEIANKLINASYTGLLGLRPGPIIRNAMQSIQTGVPIFGPKAWTAGFKGALTKEGWALARDKGIIGLENTLAEEFTHGGLAPGMVERARRWSMGAYQGVEEFNRTTSYLAARDLFESGLGKVGGEAIERNNANWKKLAKKSDIDMLSKPEQDVLSRMWDAGAPMEDIKHAYAKGIVDDTQFMYMTHERAKALQTVGGRMALGFANWGQSYASYLARMAGTGPVQKRVRNGIRWFGVNYALAQAFAKAGEYFGDEDSVHDNAGWTFAGPLFYAGGPLIDTAKTIVDAARQGYEAKVSGEPVSGKAAALVGKQVAGYLPFGTLVTQDIWKAGKEDTLKGAAGRILGFKRGKK